MLPPIHQRIADKLSCKAAQVLAAIELLDDGSTVPFIARYRKEVTGGLDDAQLRDLEEDLHYLRELEERRTKVLQSIEEQGKLSNELRAQVNLAQTKTVLEDLYLPYKPKRRTKAQIAREAGLQPLAHQLRETPEHAPEVLAAPFVSTEKEVPDTSAALDGARQILMEEWAEDPTSTANLREWLWQEGQLRSEVVKDKASEGQKFSDYFDAAEAVQKIPSHRALALFRGRKEGILSLRLIAEEDEQGRTKGERMLVAHLGLRDLGRPGDRWLLDTARLTWRAKLHVRLELDLMGRLREGAEEEAIKVFARNLSDLLLGAPAGSRATIGLDPGLRTGVKVAVVNETGHVVDTDTIYPHPPKKQWQQSVAKLRQLCEKHGVSLIAIGNGTASRETDKLAAEVVASQERKDLHKIMVSEAGASVYSASALATEELGELDVSLRGAVSIARRLQDPLAELVKIDPKSIGVGQYQHDVNQSRLSRMLDSVVEDCVNAVGVDLNTASAALLTRVSGLSSTLAQAIVEQRNIQGPFHNRSQLLKVKRLGEKTFEQAAGFLRIRDGDNPLDQSAVHPEAYPLVERIAHDSKRTVATLVGNTDFLRTLDPSPFTDDKFGLPTVRDILVELEKPGRDPRPEFKTARFEDGVEKISDLQTGMILEGVVSNVTNFGAFVDIGVHQDGLVHISAMSDKFVKDPHTIVKAGEVVRVKVLEVEIERKRIALSLRLDDPESSAKARTESQKPGEKRAGNSRSNDKRAPKQDRKSRDKPAKAPSGALADAFAKAGLRR